MDAAVQGSQNRSLKGESAEVERRTRSIVSDLLIIGQVDESEVPFDESRRIKRNADAGLKLGDRTDARLLLRRLPLTIRVKRAAALSVDTERRQLRLGRVVATVDS
ncbi:hypothetical protein, partial [Phytoactinopolyspora endophytica]|uniref:hypothetical protein n=1 Tax=Phytoactinopolyspora endophytica TaxID=1642495 RepID=UPI0013EE3E4C